MAAAVSLTAFTACGSSTNYDRLLKKDDPVVITIWHYYNGIQQSQFDEMISEAKIRQSTAGKNPFAMT